MGEGALYLIGCKKAAGAMEYQKIRYISHGNARSDICVPGTTTMTEYIIFGTRCDDLLFGPFSWLRPQLPKPEAIEPLRMAI